MDVVLSEEELPAHLTSFFEEVPSAGNWRSKDYVNVPALLAESLRADGWYLRAEVALTKVAPMPESCRDRPTRACEKLYLFAKSARYYYDQQADAPDATPASRVVTPNCASTRSAAGHDRPPSGNAKVGAVLETGDSRNLWDYWPDSDDDLPCAVWPWRPEPSKVKHYATFPLWLPLRVLRLGTSAQGCCGECGAPYRRVVERKGTRQAGGSTERVHAKATGQANGATSCFHQGQVGTYETLGWSPSCSCAAPIVPCRTLEPFSGTGTTGVAARLLGRHYTGIELSPDYARLSRERLATTNPLDDAAWVKTPTEAPERTLFEDLP